MMGNSPLGKPSMFNSLLYKVASDGDEEKMKKVLGAMQGTVAIFIILMTLS